MRQKALETLGSGDVSSMEVEIQEATVEELKDKLGELITGQLLQNPNDGLIAELLSID